MGAFWSPRAVPLVRVAFVVFGAVMLAAGAGLACQTSQGTRSPGVEMDDPFVWPDPGTTVYHSLRGDVWRPIIGERNWQKNIVDDPNHTGVTDPAVFREVASAFQEFPFYWLGLEFQGLPLSGITRSYRLHLTPPENDIRLMYGTCEPPPREGGCRAPLQISVQPCRYGPRAPEATEAGVMQVRGADAQFFTDALWLWTGDVAVRVSAYPEERVLAAAEALVAANGQGPATPDQAFPPLVSDCSDPALEP